MATVDVVIAGAGFAGLACATAAATLGLRVVVLERKPEPGASCRTTGIRVDTDRLHALLDPRLARGYIAWVVPGVGGITQVGLCTRPPVRPHMDLLLERLSGIVDLRGARTLERRAGLIPVGGPVRPWAAPGVLLLGDAAGQVSPLTGGGIHAALRTGRRAGQIIGEHSLEGGPEPGATLGPYLDSYRWKTLLRRAFDLGAPAWAIDLALPVLGPLARLVFFHERGLCSPDAWLDFFRTRPPRSPAEGAGPTGNASRARQRESRALLAGGPLAAQASPGLRIEPTTRKWPVGRRASREEVRE